LTHPMIDPGYHPVRRDQLRPEKNHDSYRHSQKPAEPTVCPECGAMFHAGRWQWGVAPEEASKLVCPACLRIHDDFPAGFVFIGGQFFTEHRDEILRLLEHHAQKEAAEHPLARIMAIKDLDSSENPRLLITTTDIHLARDLGEALNNAYRGELEFHYNEAENLLRVHWSRGL